jgi:serine/threonine-protein kinase SRPK3
VAIKINDCKYGSKEDARHELDILNRIASANPHHNGRSIPRTVLDSFEVASPNGSHLCLVFEPMRESLVLFRRRFGAGKVTRPFLPLFKVYLRILLEGLDYLHSECQIIHTGKHRILLGILKHTESLHRSEAGQYLIYVRRSVSH